MSSAPERDDTSPPCDILKRSQARPASEPETDPFRPKAKGQAFNRLRRFAAPGLLGGRPAGEKSKELLGKNRSSCYNFSIDLISGSRPAVRKETRAVEAIYALGTSCAEAERGRASFLFESAVTH
jgi:hypothetical protein